MADLLKTGMQFLGQSVKAFASETVSYARGGTQVTLQAGFGRTLFKLEDAAGGSRVEWGDRDFLILAADLAAGGIAGDPQRGDTVTLATGEVFEVLAPGGEPPWRWSDPYEVTYRVHAKKVG